MAERNDLKDYSGPELAGELVRRGDPLAYWTDDELADALAWRQTLPGIAAELEKRAEWVLAWVYDNQVDGPAGEQGKRAGGLLCKAATACREAYELQHGPAQAE